MSKKKLTIIIISILLILGIAFGIYYYFTYCYYSEDAKTVKQLLECLKTSISQYGEKGYSLSFKQKYDIESKNLNDIEEVDFAYSYDGEGSLKLSYKLNTTKISEPNISNLLLSDDGFLEGTQKEKIKYYNKEDIKDPDGEDRTEDFEYGIDNKFLINIDGNTYYASSDNNYFDYKNEKNNLKQSFNGKIDKNALKESVSDTIMTSAMQKLLFMDSWNYINELATFSNEYFKQLDFANAKQVNDFIKRNEISIENLDSNIAKVSFALDTNAIISKINNERFDYLPKIYGTIEIEKTTGDVIHFEYNFGNYLLAELMKRQEDSNYSKVNVEEFTIQGKILNKSLDGVFLNNEYKEYTKDTVKDFIKEFSEKIIPLNIEQE